MFTYYVGTRRQGIGFRRMYVCTTYAGANKRVDDLRAYAQYKRVDELRAYAQYNRVDDLRAYVQYKRVDDLRAYAQYKRVDDLLTYVQCKQVIFSASCILTIGVTES